MLVLYHGHNKAHLANFSLLITESTFPRGLSKIINKDLKGYKICKDCELFKSVCL